MPQVRVYNDNTYDYRENFRDQQIHIKAKGFILMEEGEAKLFRGAFSPITLDSDGKPHPSSYKMIRLERLKDEPAVTKTDPEKPVCQACRYEASSEKDLSEHVSASHSDILVKDEEAEAEIARRKKSKAQG